MSDAGVLCSWGLSAQGAYAEAETAATTALRLAETSGHCGGQARAHVALAIANGERARFEAAYAHLASALALARKVGNPRYEATVLQFLGIAYERAGDLDASRRVLDESLTICRQYRDHYAEVLTMLTLARVYLKGADPRARSAAEVSLALGREYNMIHHVADALGVLGKIELSEGRRADAIAHLEESVRLWRTRGWPSFLAAALRTLGDARQDGDLPAARQVWAEAQEIFVKLDSDANAAELAALLGDSPRS
jgi:tetratricopeptide (TPR) repeat protein